MNEIAIIKDIPELINQIEDNCKLSNRSFLTKVHHSPKIREFNNAESVKKVLSTLLGKIYNLSGIKEKPTPLNAQDITNLILSRFNELSLDEVYKAFELERYNAYEAKTEHYQLFNADYVSAILNKYKNSMQEWKRQNNFNMNKVIEIIPPKEEQERILRDATLKLFDNFLKTGESDIRKPHLYDYLFEKGFLPTDKEYKDKKMAMAKTILKADTRAGYGKKYTKRQMDIIISQIIKGEISAVSLAKKLVLEEYFTKLKKNNQHLKEII